MRGFVIRWLVSAIALAITAWIIKGIEIHGIFSLLIATLVLGILNAIIRPILLILTLPINILSLGIFTFVINAIMLKITASVVEGFEIHGFWAAFVGAIFMSIISTLLTYFVSDRGKFEIIVVKK